MAIETYTVHLAIAGALLALFSGVPGLFMKQPSSRGQTISLIFMLAGAVSSITGALAVIFNGKKPEVLLTWGQPSGNFTIGIDPLSAIFLILIFVISSSSAIYAIRYWGAADNPKTTSRLTFFVGLLTASLAFVVMASDSIFFLTAWEVMALSCFFAMTIEDHKAEVREAGILYLIATHVATLALFAMFSMVKFQSGSFIFPVAGTLPAENPIAAAIFITAIIGFGMKAGLIPFHIWLPSAHANAPSHVSALMSGVLIKMGIYGFFRILTFFHAPPLWWGITLLSAGIFSALLGVIFALGQHDIKRLLAYHSIENIGIIVMGIGLAQIGLSTENVALVVLGTGGALLHVVNHGLFKSLLFFAAGSTIHTTGTREIDALGGLGNRMPFTSSFFLLGATAICGLPPLNGFVSEFLLYLGFFTGIKQGTGTALPFMALAVPALAMVGGLAVTCFIKVYGTAFLGLPRTMEAERAHESHWLMLVPMAFLGILCLMIGIFPSWATALINPALTLWSPAVPLPAISAVAPLPWLTLLGIFLLLLIAVLALIFSMKTRNAPISYRPTWNCGYLAPSARIQYTASSFAEMLVKIFRGILRPHRVEPELLKLFPDKSSFRSHVPETVLELVILPFFRETDERFSIVRRLQHGQLHLYILYILIVLIALMIWAQ